MRCPLRCEEDAEPLVAPVHVIRDGPRLAGHGQGNGFSETPSQAMRAFDSRISCSMDNSMNVFVVTTIGHPNLASTRSVGVQL
eukprot:CAMPEP_0198713034 /NCGR_PEP_ID=MMETSP1471-20131121/4640_1 /TAXON_ID=41880 /ORGANISM="Pycnococcus provasolii, Strain RCC733" /LENGTH=82 /DNA_ID=CAMNT_0044473047 /DNA_START=95 /DNA_END=344 /DNA_ORIENTATION=-